METTNLATLAMHGFARSWKRAPRFVEGMLAYLTAHTVRVVEAR